MYILSSLSELVFPSGIYCIACGNLIDETRPYALCDKCVREVNWNAGRVCSRCGRPLQDIGADIIKSKEGEALCSSCMHDEPVFDIGVSCAVYEGVVRSIIRNLKYRNMPYAASKVADAMADRYLACRSVCPETGEFSLPDIVVSVPMNRNKKLRRGYDQAELIGRAFAGRIGAYYYPGMLARTFDTAVMSSISGVERRANLVGAFALGFGITDKDCAGKNILLIDDVYTTGSTADACAGVLKGAGASRVDFYAFAAATNFVQPMS